MSSTILHLILLLPLFSSSEISYRLLLCPAMVNYMEARPAVSVVTMWPTICFAYLRQTTKKCDTKFIVITTLFPYLWWTILSRACYSGLVVCVIIPSKQ
jgi:hypothetical protein